MVASATGEVKQTIELPEIVIEHPFAEFAHQNEKEETL